MSPWPPQVWRQLIQLYVRSHPLSYQSHCTHPLTCFQVTIFLERTFQILLVYKTFIPKGDHETHLDHVSAWIPSQVWRYRTCAEMFTIGMYAMSHRIRCPWLVLSSHLLETRGITYPVTDHMHDLSSQYISYACMYVLRYKYNHYNFYSSLIIYSENVQTLLLYY